MFQTWIVPVLIVCLVVVIVYAFASRRRHGATTDELKPPRAIRRGKHINE